MLIYRINVLEQLKDAGYNTNRLRKEKHLSEATIQALRNNKMIGINSLDKICELLEMQPQHIIKYVETPKETN